MSSCGLQEYGPVTVESIQSNGVVTLDGTTVTGVVSCNGTLKATGADMNHLIVNGQVTLKQSIVRSDMLINGKLTASGSQLSGTLSIASEKTDLIDTKAEDIIVRKVEGDSREQLLILSDQTVVQGSIQFESGSGKVILENTARVLGDILGGEILETSSGLKN